MGFHDVVSSGSHFLTALWASFATLILLRLTRGHGHGRVAVAVFGVSMVFLFTASAAFHGLKHGNADAVKLYQKIDKSAVFLLIAGAYTPVMAYFLRDRWRVYSLAGLWGWVAVGVASLWAFPDLPHTWLVGIYAVTALSGLLPTPMYVAAINQSPLKWIALIVGPFALGGGAEAAEWPTLYPGLLGPHELMHFAVSVGVFVHFGFVMRHVISRPPLANTLPVPTTDDRDVADTAIEWAALRLSSLTRLPKPERPTKLTTA